MVDEYLWDERKELITLKGLSRRANQSKSKAMIGIKGDLLQIEKKDYNN